MNGDNRDFSSVPPPFIESPGMTLSDESNGKPSFEELPEKEQDRRLILAERYTNIEIDRENNRHREEAGRQYLGFASLVSVVVIVLSAFTYAGMTRDNSLSEKVIDTMIGVLGGGGAAVAFVKKQR